jgi:2-aminoadipate transaminase
VFWEVIVKSIKYARRMQHLRSSDIREILKVTADPEIISFAGGLPAPELFPVEELRRIADDVLRTEGRRVLQYSTSEGDPELRGLIADRLSTGLGAPTAPGEVLITCGSQQGLDLTGKLLLDEGDVVLCESPTYLAAIQAFQAYGATFVEVATDDDGMLPDDLERRLTENERVKLVYVVPDFQNPTGRCWSLARRRRLLELANRYGVPVVEDAPYAELRFAGEPVPPLKALDTEGRVIFLGTCSKIFCPGIRIGWIVADAELLGKFVLAKQGVDLHTSTLSQRLLAVYLQDDDPDARIVRICDTYRERRDLMVAALADEMPPGVAFTRPDGGMFLWATLPRELNARDVLVRSIERRVAFVPGGSFFPNGGHENTMRLNFSNTPPDRITDGVQRLAGAVRESSGTRRPVSAPVDERRPAGVGAGTRD